MFFNLAWRNSKRNRSENLIYFLTMVTAVATFYIVLSLGSQDVMRFLEEIESDAVNRLLTMLMPTVHLFSLLFVFFLVIFANKYQLECRSRELGLYLMFGMTKRHLFIQIMAEGLITSLLALLGGLICGGFLSEVISLATARLVGRGIIAHQSSFSVSAVLLTTLGFLMIQVAAFVIPFVISIHKRSKIDAAFRRFLLEPDDTNEYLLCESAPASMRPYIHELAHHLRMQEGYVNEQQLKVANYESYIENWVHEIKKPLSLMTLLLDNRKDEMSPLVHTRMLYVRDHTRQNVEQILYFSRLGAVHKDYYFEPLPILETCKEAVEDNLSLLEEAHFSVTYSGNNCTAISDKKGFMFILGQIISNSVKYAAHDATPAIHFSVSDNKEIGQIVLSICDNGTGIPASDLPFVFDKGFTGDVGSYLSRSTGMGLYLVQQMASDLTIKIDIHSNTNGGTTVILTFPKVERPLGR